LELTRFGAFGLTIQRKKRKALRISLDKNAATLTFVSSGDAKADLQMIDLLLDEASR
jgi:hypothetical protein